MGDLIGLALDLHWLGRLGDFALEFRLGFLKLTQAFTNSLGQFRKFLRSEQQKTEQENENQLRKTRGSQGQ